METKTTLVGSDCGIELQLAIAAGKGSCLNSIATVDLHFAFIIFPNDTELDDSFGDLAVRAFPEGGRTVTTESTFFNSGFFSKSVLLSKVEMISSLA